MSSPAERLVKNVSKIYSLPTIYYRIEKAIEDPNSSLKQIGNIILDDPSLAARLLRLANSAFFNFPQKIDSIPTALSIIGTKQLRDLVLASTVIKVFKDIPEELVNMESFWRHSIACGITARVIAADMNADNIEAFFVAGLLHDIGALIMFAQLSDSIAEVMTICKQEKQYRYLTEKQNLEFNHAEVGGYLLKEWELPEHLIIACMRHHEPHHARHFTEYAAAIHVADCFVNALQIGSSGEHLAPNMERKAWRTLNLSEKFFNSEMQQIERQYKEAVSYILDD
ncbi:MAG: HDOD domain-containing protein [Gammaproteobacteria bacterium]|nr:HDOD domain-containing protein [Gammaproteobacteria bacterium]